MKIEEFRSKLQGGGYRPNQFRVTVPFPAFAIEGSAQSDMEFLCLSATFPGRGISEIPVKYRGTTVRLAGDREVTPDWTVSVYNSKSFDILSTLEAWQNYYLNNDSVGGANDMPTIEATIEALDKNDSVLKTYTMINFWPRKIEPVVLSQDTENTISTFNASFAYDYWI